MKEIKVKVTYTEGHAKRFTAACIKAAEKREKHEKEESRRQTKV